MEAARQTYPEYKNTAIPGFPSLPKHWQVARLKHLCDYHSLYGANIPASEYRDTGVRFLRTTDITDEGLLTNEGVYLPTQAVAEYILGDGDILLSRSGTVGRSFLYRHKIHGPCAYAGYLVRFVPKSHPLANYIHLFTKTTAFTEFIRTSAISSTIDNVNAEKYANCRLPLPPPDEQADIVRYLHHADQLISRYISAKERLIPLLEEQRQAAIQQTVTRGLHSTTPLKQSGVPWIGEIPRDWNVRRLRTLVDISTGGRDTINSVDDGQYPFFVRSQTVERINTWSFDGEAVLTAGDGVGVGRVFHYINGKFDYHQRVYKFSGFTGIAGRLFHHYFSAMLRFQTSQGTAKSTVDSLRLPMLQNFPVVVPPPHIQAQLVQQLDRITSSAEEAIEIANRQIDLTNEYRTRLIADVVTGQIDVRHAAVELHV